MLEGLFGNKTVQKILIFLFLNGKCYGSQLQKQLKCSLTPLQKGLLRLERGGIVKSYYEGKTRVYQFNTNYPFYEELEALLKKAYSLLPVHEKRDYYAPKQEPAFEKLTPKEGRIVLVNFWKKLADVKVLSFHATSKSKVVTGWNAKGKGSVNLISQGSFTMISQEKGSWKGKGGEEMGFSNSFRWSMDLQKGIISLEHLRRGPEFPVFLFNMVPSGPSSLISIDSHLCEKDSYFGQIFFDLAKIHLNWRVVGAKKDEEIHYIYH